MKKIMGFLKKPSKQQQQPEEDPAPYRLISNNNDDSVMSLSSVLEEQQQPSHSQEEIRKQRLARLDKQQQQNVPQRGPSKDITNHPLTIEFGQNAYLVHTFLEDIYLNTFHKTSLSRNPQLKLLQPATSIEEIRLYTQENMVQDIITFLQSETYYPSSLDKLTYLHDVYGRIGSKSQEDLISEEKLYTLQKTVLKSLMDFLSNSIALEDPRTITDFNNPLFDTLYTKLSAIASNGFFHQFIRNLPEENYDNILTPIFKRMIRDTAENSVSKREKIFNTLTLFQELMNCSPKIVDFLFQHELYAPQNATGLDYQRNTVFGVFLSFTIMDNTSNSMWPHLDLSANQPSKRASVYATYRKKIHEPIDAFQKLLESLIKLNPKYKRNILDWIYGVLRANKQMETCNYKPEDKVASRGWFCNFLVLLLKLCENLLQDPNKYPTWISKFDLNYIYSNPVFEDKLLLDGTKVPPVSPEKYQELQESKFSFGTELIFATTYACFHFRDLVNTFYKNPQNSKEKKQTFSQEQVIASRQVARSRIQLLDPYLMEQLHKLINFQTLLMLHAYGQKISGAQDLSMSGSTFLLEQLQAPSQDRRPPIPKFWCFNAFNYFHHFAVVDNDLLPKSFSDLNLLMNFTLSLAMNKFDTNQPNLKTLSLRVIAMLSEHAKTGMADEQVVMILKSSFFYEKNLPQALIDNFLVSKEIYIIEKKTPPEFNPTRSESLQTFNRLLDGVFLGSSNCYLIKHLKNLQKDDQEQYLQFMNIFMDDIVSLLDELCVLLAQNQVPDELKQDHRTSLDWRMIVLWHYTRFAASLSQHCPEFFLDDIVRDQFAVCLNYSLRAFYSQGFMALATRIETSTPGLFMASLAKSYVNLAHADDFIQSIVNDGENCGVAYFYQTQDWLGGNQILSDGDKNKFSQLISTLDLLTQSNS